MNYKTLEQFSAELEAARGRLGERAADVSVGSEAGRSFRESEVRCDFDLPYSTMPTLSGKRWNSRDSFIQI